MLTILMGVPVTADMETEVLIIWPPPSPWEPSISMNSSGMPLVNDLVGKEPCDLGNEKGLM
jgi:hypothetical protein